MGPRFVGILARQIEAQCKVSVRVQGHRASALGHTVCLGQVPKRQAMGKVTQSSNGSGFVKIGKVCEPDSELTRIAVAATAVQSVEHDSGEGRGTVGIRSMAQVEKAERTN